MATTNSGPVDEIKARGVITDADVQTLRRTHYQDGVIGAPEAGALIALHRACSEHSPAWVEFFVEALTDYTVNQAVPEGYITAENAHWLTKELAPKGLVASKAEFELVINVLDKSRWSPQSLVCFALEQVKYAVIDGDGPLRGRGHVAESGVSDADVEVLRRVLYAFGGDGNVAITAPEADLLFDINDATIDATNAESWRDLFVKAIANCVLSASGYTVPSREQALARDAWLDSRGDLRLGRALSGMLSGYRELSSEERAIAVLERHKIEIVTGEEVTPTEAQWLAHRIGRDGRITANELALLDFLKSENPELHPDLQALIDGKPARAA